MAAGQVSVRSIPLHPCNHHMSLVSSQAAATLPSATPQFERVWMQFLQATESRRRHSLLGTPQPLAGTTPSVPPRQWEPFTALIRGIIENASEALATTRGRGEETHPGVVPASDTGDSLHRLGRPVAMAQHVDMTCSTSLVGGVDLIHRGSPCMYYDV